MHCREYQKFGRAQFTKCAFEPCSSAVFLPSNTMQDSQGALRLPCYCTPREPNNRGLGMMRAHILFCRDAPSRQTALCSINRSSWVQRLHPKSYPSSRAEPHTPVFAGTACHKTIRAGVPVLPTALRHRHVLCGADVVLLLVPSCLPHALLPRTASTALSRWPLH